MSLISRRGFVLALMTLGLVLGGASRVLATDNLGMLYATVSLPSGISKDAVKNAVVATLNGREWQVQSQEGDQVQGYLKHRKNEAIVTLVISESKVELYCQGWKIDKKTGARIEPELPHGWLKNIQKDLSKRLDVPFSK